MTNGLVSLVMPAWRPRPDWLRQAVQAALGQRDCSIELLVVDDGSPEPVAELLSEFEDPRLRVLRVEHGGEAHARNAGAAASTGDFVRYIDADDTIEESGTARLIRLNGGREDVVAYGATVFCDENLRPIWSMSSKVQGDAVEACLLGKFTTRPHAFLFPRAIVERAGGWSSEFKVSGDWDFVLRTLEHGSVKGTKDPVTYYRRHPGGMTGDLDHGLEGAQLVVDRYFERHPEQRGTRLERRARARLLAHSGRVYATHGVRAEGLRRMLRAAALDPTAVTTEIRQGLPALRGALRRRVGRAPAGTSSGSARAR